MNDENIIEIENLKKEYKTYKRGTSFTENKNSGSFEKTFGHSSIKRYFRKWTADGRNYYKNLQRIS